LLGVVGLLALVAGAGGAWWRTRPQAPGDPAVAILFAQRFVDADGRERALSEWRDRVLIVNFWATWCAPCVEELPDLQQVRDEYAARGVEVIGIGIDNANNIVAFRDRLGIRFPLLVAGAGGSELGRTLGNQAGVLPFTALVTRDGRIVQRRIGQVKPAELRLWLEAQGP
jgi:thiol-disulfide isomerase/thioredoxin